MVVWNSAEMSLVRSIKVYDYLRIDIFTNFDFSSRFSQSFLGSTPNGLLTMILSFTCTIKISTCFFSYPPNNTSMDSKGTTLIHSSHHLRVSSSVPLWEVPNVMRISHTMIL